MSRSARRFRFSRVKPVTRGISREDPSDPGTEWHDPEHLMEKWTMKLSTRSIALAGSIIVLAACSNDASTPSGLLAPRQSRAWGPETPSFNLEVILRGDGFGLVKFRQPNDDALIINLDTKVRGLEPNTAYVLQRAADTNLDGVCPSAPTSWLTLGKGLTPQTIITDARGTGEESLFRSVAAL